LRFFLLLGGMLAGFAPYAAIAQSAPPAGERTGTDDPASPTGKPQGSMPAAPARPDAPKAQPSASEEIVVTGVRREGQDILAGTATLSGASLTRELRPTIGETLARQPGVSASSFGPNASRPVLRGMQGERALILTDGIGSLDVSSTSADHAVAINPLTAERVEVLRGPAALVYGSAAIGGIVDVVDARIPRRVPHEPAHVDAIASYGSAANERSGNAAADVPVGGNFVFHVDGNYSETDDLRIGGFVLSPALRAEAAASPDPEVQALARLKGRLPNSAARTWDVAAGGAYVDGENNVGLSVNHYDSLYGVPIRYSLDPSIDAEAPRIHIRQNRADARAEIDTGDGFLDSVRLRAGYSDYRHDELEASGAIGTTFLSKGYEARLDFIQSTRDGWGGEFGAQYLHRNFNVIGAEKFLPRNNDGELGLFALQSLERGPFKAEAAGRYEHSSIQAFADAGLGNGDMRRSFDAVSGALGASYEIARGVRLGLNASHSERAPSAEELFANGPHGGTQAFEVGDPALKVEKSWGLEATLRASGDGYELGASLYRSWFQHYIFDERTGEVRDNLPVFQNRQADARYSGFEVEGSLRVATIGDYAVNLDALADYTRAAIVSSGPAPRIPPLRFLGGVEAQSDRLQGRIEVEQVASQHRTAQLETPTDSYTMVNASLSFQPFKSRGNSSSITLSANNIFDVDARRHASFLKDFAPLPGRDIRVTARVVL